MSVKSSTLAFALIGTLGLLAAGCSGQSVDPNGDNGGSDFTTVSVPGCTGDCRVRNDCPSSGATTVTGIVNIPAGNLPLYNARVYIPADMLPTTPITGATCDRCDSIPASVASAATDINGRFTLTGVPAGDNIPLVVSVGKWRRVTTLPTITHCSNTELDADKTRLPRNQSEGNIPKIALTTGAADAMECILRSGKLGLDPSEFTLPSGNGRVNLYAGGGYSAVTATSKYAAGFNGSAAATPLPTANPWWDQASNLSAYDIVILSCEGALNDASKSTSAKAALQSYLDKGGRVFASHWHNDWILNGTQALKSVATISTGLMGPDPTTDTIDTSFTKGAALADWLMLPGVGGSTTRGQLPVVQARYSVSKISSAAPINVQRWVSGATTDGTNVAQYFSFNTPVGADAAMQCGQMVFTDLHVSAGTGTGAVDTGGPDFPNGCMASSLSPQEKALIFMLFDLTNCLTTSAG